MTTPLPPSALIATLTRFRAQVDKRDAAAIKQLASAYSKLFKRLQAELELEARRIFDGNDSVSRTYLTNRLADLADSIEAELKKYSNFLETTIDTTADDALTLGSRHALELLQAATGRKGLASINFGILNPTQINTIIGFLAPGSPLFKRIGQMARFHAPIVRDQLIEAIALGFNPNKAAGNIAPYLADIADKFKISMARPFADAVKMTRTAMLYSYRESTRANYQANEDVVTGWSWYAELDETTCASCMAMHGSIHELDETLNDHHHGRCAMLPVVLDQPLVSESAGRDYFDNLSDAQKQGVLGKGAFDAFQEGKFEFSQLSKEHDDDVYGPMRSVPSLQELIGE